MTGFRMRIDHVPGEPEVKETWVIKTWRPKGSRCPIKSDVFALKASPTPEQDRV